MKRWLVPVAALLAAASFGAGYAAASKGKVAGQISYEDRAAINDLMIRYSHYIDTHQAEAWASLFTADGELQFPGGANPKGRDALVKFATRPAGDVQGAHFVGNSLLVEVAPGRVHARSMIILGRADRTKQFSANFNALGVYVDDIVKTKGGWKFQSRKSDTSLPVTEEFLP